MIDKKSAWFLGIFIILVATVINHYYEIGMMGLTGFILAYLTKGMRRRKSKEQE